MEEKLTVTTNKPTEEQKELIMKKIKEFLEGLYNKWKVMKQMTKEQKIYCKIGQAVCKGTALILFYGFWIGIGIGFLMK